MNAKFKLIQLVEDDNSHQEESCFENTMGSSRTKLT